MASSGWMTTFYYMQDLRSLYMNGVLNAGFKPGIYNADMTLYTINEGDQTSEASGLYLYVKKGTTFIFSNSVSHDANGYHRDLTNIGSYLIKCVATVDQRIPIAELSATSGDKNSVLFGNVQSGAKAESKLFLTALMLYNAEDNEGLDAPQFCIAKINSDRQSDEGYYTLVDMEYTLPEGPVQTINANLSYLFAGVINTPYSDKTYINGNAWTSSTSAEDWAKDHVFIARGLPDYRQTLIADDPSNTPDVIASPDFKSLFVDVGDFSEGDIIYNRSYSWEDVYGVTGSQALQGDFVAVNEDAYSGKTCETQFNEVSDSSKLLMDLVFLSSRTRYNNFLNEQNTDLTSMFSEAVSQNPYKINPTVKYIRISSLNGFSGDSLNPRANTYKEQYGLVGTENIVPLDLSKINIERLVKFIRNRNVLPAIISYMRYNGYLDPRRETNIAPLVLIFRGATDSSGNLTADDTISAWGSTTNRINPANILSFADLQFKSTKLESMNVKDQEVYSTIPVIE